MVWTYKPAGPKIIIENTQMHLQKAVAAVKNRRLTLRQASEKYGVLVKTIREHKRGIHESIYEWIYHEYKMNQSFIKLYPLFYKNVYFSTTSPLERPKVVHNANRKCVRLYPT